MAWDQCCTLASCGGSNMLLPQSRVMRARDWAHSRKVDLSKFRTVQLGHNSLVPAFSRAWKVSVILCLTGLLGLIQAIVAYPSNR